jgi:hypothetical protein
VSKEIALSSDSPEDDEMEIDPARKRRWVGLATYALVYLGVGAILVFLLTRLATSWALAIGLVAFMIGYMTLMGYLAGRKPDRKE